MSAPQDCLPDAGLVRSDPAAPGWTRRRRGRGFSYLDEHGGPLTDPAQRVRVKALVIPPAWRDVWISPDPAGHIQALGTDDAGRRQYLYHEEWRRARDAEKHDRVLGLGVGLPAVRAEVAARLEERGLGPRRVLAAAVRMLDVGVFRAGGEQYAPTDSGDDGTFGLATLRREHVRLRRGEVHFEYPAKGGIERALSLPDPALHKVVGALLRRRGGGGDLLVYRIGRGWHDVRAEDLNEAVKELAGEQYSCKDLRTWNATVLAAVTLAAAAAAGGGVPATARGRQRAVRATMQAVSEHLGNTPTVARSSYVDPRVVQRFEEGATVLAALRRIGPAHERPDLIDDVTRAALDRAVVRLIRGR